MDASEDVREAVLVDPATILKIAKALSDESALERPIEAVLRAAVEHAGAGRGALLVARDDELRVAAEATAAGSAIAVAPRDAPVAGAELPESIVRHVARTREAVHVRDARAGGAFSEDAYVRRSQARSLLAVPLATVGRVGAVLYLEDDRADAFTPARRAVLDALAAQAATSLENARLRAELERRQARIDQAQRVAHVGYWERELDEGRITLSEESCRIFGMPPRERVESLAEWHDRWLTLIHPDDRSKIADAAAAALRGGPPYEVEYRVVRPGGDVRVVRSRAEVTRDESGRPRRMFGVMQDITEVRRAEDALRASESRFRTFVDHATDGFFLHDDELHVIDANRQACESLGYRREELIGMHPGEFDVGLDPASIVRLGERVAAGETVTFESAHRRKDGTVFPVEIRSRRFQQGDRPFRLSLVRDITERKRAEEERRTYVWFLESMDRVHRAIRGTDDLEQMLDDVLDEVLAIFDCDRATLGTYSGEPEATSFRVTAIRTRPGFAAVLARGFEGPIDEELRVIPRALKAARGPVQFTAHTDPPLPQVLAERFSFRAMLGMAVFPHVHEPGRFHHFTLAQCSRERVWAPHEVRLFDEIARRLDDAVSSLATLRNLRESEARFRTFVDFAADAFMLHDEDAIIVDVNRQACESLGYAREELIGMTPGDFDAELGADALRRVRERLAAGEIVTLETQHRRKDGTVFPVEVRGRQIRLGDREFAITLTRDITERRRAEGERDRLRQAQAELARISRFTTMGELTASLAHEIKQPIAAAVTNASTCIRWLARTPPDLAEAREAAARILQDSTRAAQIIDRVRALFKKDASRREPVDVNAIVRETVTLLRSEAARHSVAIQVELASDLPRVEADRVQLQQVLVNLMLNGIEAMNDAPGELSVASRRGPRGELVVAVSDEGVGLPGGRADNIFDAFFTTKPHGTGMGLTISRSIVESHGGRLWATAREGRGTTFQVALPAAADRAATERAGVER